MEVKIDNSRKEVLQGEFEKPYFADIKNKLIEDRKIYTLYPPVTLIFNAFDTTPFENVKVVILGQDPYHWPGQAMWLSFSVPEWIPLSPSLKNIYKEIEDDIWIKQSSSWDLTPWAKQWVLLLNAFLSVRDGQPASHQKIWRELFTDAVIKTISEKKDHVVFILWWNFARSKKVLIEANKHLVLESAHPSPLSAYNWFFWSKHFGKTNEYLKKYWLKEIDWKI